MLESLYLSAPTLVCFDGILTPPPPVEPPVETGLNEPAPVFEDFTAEQQEKFNKALAEDRRKHQTALKKAEDRIQQTLNTAKLSQDERAKMEETLEGIRSEFLTKEQKAKHEKKQLEETYTARIAELESRASTAEQRYTDSVVHRALLDASVAGDAFNPDVVVRVLRDFVKMDENGNPVIDFPDEEAETGKPIITRRTPADAVSRMKELAHKYGNLFKSNVVSGIGGSSATGSLTPGPNGRIDVAKLTSEEYRKVRKESPELLGLVKNR